MKKRILAMLLVLSVLFATSVNIVLGGGDGTPPIIVPTSAPITFPFDGEY